MLMDTETVYRKRGRKYEPIGEYEMCGGMVWPEGCHLVVSFPGGGTSYRYGIDPEMAGYLASVKILRNRLSELMLEAMRPRLSMRNCSVPEDVQRNAWAAYIAAGGDPGGVRLVCGSVNDIIDQALAELESEMEKSNV